MTVDNRSLEMNPDQVLKSIDIPILDVRPWEERLGDIGFIPGSRCFPMEDIIKKQNEFIAKYPPKQPLILVCLSGNRSLQLQEILTRYGYSQVYNLKDGILSWSTAHYPLCGCNTSFEDDLPRVENMDDFVRTVVSCFVAETIETCMDSDTGDLPVDNPREVVESLFETVTNCSHYFKTDVLDALDQLAQQARFQGHAISNIADNLDRMSQIVDSMNLDNPPGE